jgi:hypothetical protein
VDDDPVIAEVKAKQIKKRAKKDTNKKLLSTLYSSSLSPFFVVF